MYNTFCKKSRYLMATFLVVMMIGLAFSCKKDSYLTDGGLAVANTSLSTYDYLASNQYHYFDTLIMIIDHLGLKDSINQAGTFFAPTDYAIQRVMGSNNMTTLDDLYKKINSKFLTQYMFTDKSLTLENATTTVKTYTSWAGSSVGLKKLASSYTVANSSLTYYTLEYVKVNNALDGSPDAAEDDQTDAVLPCQTTGIQTSSGTNLNVLSNTATLDLFLPEQPKKTFTFNVNVVQNDDYSGSTVQLDSTALSSYFGIPVTDMSNLLAAGTDSLIYYNMQSDGTLSNDYTANPPGFWLDANGDVALWGDDANLFAEFDPFGYVINIGAYPGNPQIGDSFTIKPAIVLLKSDGSTVTAIFKIKITIVSP